MSMIDRVAAFARKVWLPSGVALAAAVGLSAGAWGTSVPRADTSSAPPAAAAGFPGGAVKGRAACPLARGAKGATSTATVVAAATGGAARSRLTSGPGRKSVTGRRLAKASDGCGDSYCDEDEGEDCESCSDDCGKCCSNGRCDHNEDCESCPDDCGKCCGNGACDHNEDCESCPGDCNGPCCGNGICDHREDCSSCPEDCGNCCGNGFCDREHEACHSCPEDCPCSGHDLECFPNQHDCEAVCLGVCERRINCGSESAYKCFE